MSGLADKFLDALEKKENAMGNNNSESSDEDDDNNIEDIIHDV